MRIFLGFLWAETSVICMRPIARPPAVSGNNRRLVVWRSLGARALILHSTPRWEFISRETQKAAAPLTRRALCLRPRPVWPPSQRRRRRFQNTLSAARQRGGGVDLFDGATPKSRLISNKLGLKSALMTIFALDQALIKSHKELIMCLSCFYNGCTTHYVNFVIIPDKTFNTFSWNKL